MRCDCPELGSDFEHCLSSEIAPAKRLSQHPIDFSLSSLFVIGAIDRRFVYGEAQGGGVDSKS